MTLFPNTIPSAEPFYMPGNQTGCILLHGFTGTPKEMRWLGEYLNNNSITIIAPRLTGHATNPEDMQRSSWRDWITSVEDAYHYIRPNVDRLLVIGLSMGGMLACITASYLQFDGLVTISTPYEIPQKDWRLRFVRQLSILQPKVGKGSGDWHNLDAAKDHVDYPYHPTRSIAELLDLFVELRRTLPKLKLPSLHIHSTEDQSVPYFHLQKIYENNGSPNKQLMKVQNSGHVVIREPDRFRVFEKILEFILEA
ncbi:MAG: alpha/beta fold hydrolase [Anaerolineaceae bacterium]|nr:alpha/beta fold hydrolase [Anaerolineaceae bacterium]